MAYIKFCDQGGFYLMRSGPVYPSEPSNGTPYSLIMATCYWTLNSTVLSKN